MVIILDLMLVLEIRSTLMITLCAYIEVVAPLHTVPLATLHTL